MSAEPVVRLHGGHLFDSSVKHHRFLHKDTHFHKPGHELVQIQQVQTSTDACYICRLCRTTKKNYKSPKAGISQDSQMRTNLIQTTAALSHSHFIMTLGTSPDAILLVSPAAALLLDGRCCTKQQRYKHENSRLMNLAAGAQEVCGMTTYQNTVGCYAEMSNSGYKFSKNKRKRKIGAVIIM